MHTNHSFSTLVNPTSYQDKWGLQGHTLFFSVPSRPLAYTYIRLHIQIYTPHTHIYIYVCIIIFIVIKCYRFSNRRIKLACMTGKSSDQTAHMHRPIRTFAVQMSLQWVPSRPHKNAASLNTSHYRYKSFFTLIKA